jgi:UDP-N-acetyl-D-mannosaminuronic acid dehydrogenase
LPPAHHLKPEDLDTPETRRSYTVGIVGCAERGVQIAKAFAEAGYRVICIEGDQSLVKRLSKANLVFEAKEDKAKWRNFLRTGQLTATSELKASAQCSIVIVAISAKIDEKHNPDYQELQTTTKQLGASLQRGTLIVYAGVAGFGFTSGTFKETLENTAALKAGEDFALAYCPPNGSPTEKTDVATEMLKVAADDKTSLNAAATLFATLTTKGVLKLSDVKTAELAALFAAVKRDVNVALANELAVFCETAGMDYKATQQLVGGEYGVFQTSISEESNRIEAYLLLESADALNAKLRLPALARQINEEQAKHAIALTQDALRNGGKPLRRARVAVLGTEDAGTNVFVALLEAKGAKVTSFDPDGAAEENGAGSRGCKKTLSEAVEGTDCLVVLACVGELGNLNLKRLHSLMRFPAALVDLTGALDPVKVEEVGFVYRGLGRGVWKR